MHLLLKDIVEAGRPLAAAEAGGVAAVVYHERHPPRMHVGVQAVHRLDDGLVADLAVRVALQPRPSPVSGHVKLCVVLACSMVQ